MSEPSHTWYPIFEQREESIQEVPCIHSDVEAEKHDFVEGREEQWSKEAVTDENRMRKGGHKGD